MSPVLENPTTGLRARIAGILLLPLLALALPGDAPHAEPAPHNFGINGKDTSEYPADPRDWHMREPGSHPTWSIGTDMPNDVFTFVRLRYPSGGGNGRRWRHENWRIDYPGSDVNFPYRLQQVTSMRVNPKSVIVDIDREQMRHYPFIYMLEVGDIDITDEQAKIMRDYMMNGGFIMVDDNWGSREWANWMRAFKQIFPDRDMKELTLQDEIFHAVFDLKVIPQIPGIGWFYRGYTYEADKPDSEGAHYYAVHDDKGRMIMFIGHNTDLGDGWEEEGTDPRYYAAYSEKYAFPLGINVVFYALTH
jgi:hypothetical protein